MHAIWGLCTAQRSAAVPHHQRHGHNVYLSYIFNPPSSHHSLPHYDINYRRQTQQCWYHSMWHQDELPQTPHDPAPMADPKSLIRGISNGFVNGESKSTRVLIQDRNCSQRPDLVECSARVSTPLKFWVCGYLLYFGTLMLLPIVPHSPFQFVITPIGICNCFSEELASSSLIFWRASPRWYLWMKWI